MKHSVLNTIVKSYSKKNYSKDHSASTTSQPPVH